VSARPPVLRPVGEPNADVFQRETREAIKVLAEAPLATPTELVNVTVGTSTTLVSHGLGRRFRRWHLADLQGDARVWRDATSTADPAVYLPLRASASVTVTILVE
jgi:hypothetical protein